MAKRTVFQRLNTIFGPEGVRQDKIQSNKYSMNNDILLKTQSKEEFDTVKLQNQQNKYLKNVWRKVDGELFQQSIHYETTRIGSYSDFESMEFYPEIAAALDVMMEEATTTNDKGKILNVYSDSNRIKGILEDLFFNRMDIHVSLPMWTRNTAKYGDNFLLLNIDNSKGVLGARQLPNFEIERREGDIVDSIINGRNRINVDDVSDETSKVKFYWRGRDVEFNSWQIAHFRLLGDDRRLPYGVSVLEKARRVWKQLQLAEDAMLVYRITRAPERRIYKIYVGNIDEEDVPAYVDEIANRFKRTPIIDPQTGQIDVRYNTMPVWKNTPIPLLDGRTITIEELAKEYDNGKENWVYSIQDDTHQVVGGKVDWCGKNYTADRMVKVWLDDDTYIVTAEEHPFVMRDGSKKRADELNENDSLMPFYRDDKSFNSKSNHSKYERVYNPNSGKYEFTHKLVAKEIDRLIIEDLINLNQFNITEEYVDTVQLNHKVKSIEFIGGDDVYCMTVLGKNGEDDRHNFAVLSFKSDGEISVSGSFLGNSNDQDYFIPVRDENAPSPIDTLPGASNLDQIADIQYLQRKLFTALRVPKQFLNFDEAQGEGKNLSLQDVRFSRTINRIQQAMLAELNKVAIIHLLLLGFEDDLDNFTLTLNNPSTQAEMLKVEQTQMKITLFKDAVSDAGNGFAPMSMTRAHREILNWSDDEIKQDLLEQRIEKAAAAELENTSQVIKYTGMFDKVDLIYGDIEAAKAGGSASEEGGEEGGGPIGGGGGGFGGGGLEFGDEEASEETPEGGGDEVPEGGGDEVPEASSVAPEEAPLAESIRNKKKVITEQLLGGKVKKPINKKVNTKSFDNLLESINDKDNEIILNERVKIYDKSLKINQDINDVINDIDKMLGE